MDEKKTRRKGFPLRLDPSIADHIAKLASAEFRSANAQIEMMLRRAPSSSQQNTPHNAPSMAPRGSKRKNIALRLPSLLLDQLSEQALASGRSLNAHIEMILARGIPARGSLGESKD